MEGSELTVRVRFFAAAEEFAGRAEAVRSEADLCDRRFRPSNPRSGRLCRAALSSSAAKSPTSRRPTRWLTATRANLLTFHARARRCVADNQGVPRSTRAYRGLAQASRLMITDIVMRRPGIALAELGTLTGLHDNTLRDHLKVLSAEGMVHSKTEHRAGRGRPRLVYYAVDAGTESTIAQARVDEAKRRGDLLRRVMPVEPVDLDGEAVHQLDALYEHLDSVGLAPQLDEERLSVQLTPCPFHKLIAEHPDTICHVHEELVRDVLLRAGGPVQVEKLLPFVTPHACVLRLRVAVEE